MFSYITNSTDRLFYEVNGDPNRTVQLEFHLYWKIHSTFKAADFPALAAPASNLGIVCKFPLSDM